MKFSDHPTNETTSNITSGELVREKGRKYWKDKNILIIEDVISNFLLLVAYLTPSGANIIHEEFGVQAVETLRSRSDINLILVDLRLPDVHGLEVTKRIREFDTETPIIAQTAFAMHFDRKHCIDAGCNDYIAKPIIQREFLNILSKYFNS